MGGNAYAINKIIAPICPHGQTPSAALCRCGWEWRCPTVDGDGGAAVGEGFCDSDAYSLSGSYLFCSEFEVDQMTVVHVFPHITWEAAGCGHAHGKISCVPGREPGVTGVHVRWLRLLIDYVVECGGGGGRGGLPCRVSIQS